MALIRIPPGFENSPLVVKTSKVNHTIYVEDSKTIDGPVSKQHKYSIGLACMRYINGYPEILLVCKRYTYAFSEFVHGKYTMLFHSNYQKTKQDLIDLFSKMTVEEKVDILSLDFNKIWYKVWLNGSKPPSYFYAKNKFESTFLVDGGVRLKKLLSKSTNSQKVWEIPKGRKKSKEESDIICAVREFKEETGIQKNQYKILPGIIRKFSHTDANITYTNTYYLAVMTHKIEPQISFITNEQISEIGDIRWMSMAMIRVIDTDGRLENFIKPLMRIGRCT
jgi:8-oxo-dGTP pyrophosphatase MutT (NUDIX family)